MSHYPKAMGTIEGHDKDRDSDFSRQFSRDFFGSLPEPEFFYQTIGKSILGSGFFPRQFPETFLENPEWRPAGFVTTGRETLRNYYHAKGVLTPSLQHR
jgi:hypothetical protein